MLVKEIMTKEVVTIDHNATVLDVCNKYSENRVGCLIVMNKDNPVGIVTERDIIEKIVRMGLSSKKTKVKEIMSSNLKMIHASAKVEEAAEVMKKNKIKKLPVLLNNKIAGIITVTDIANVLPDFSKRTIHEKQSFRLV